MKETTTEKYLTELSDKGTELVVQLVIMLFILFFSILMLWVHIKPSKSLTKKLNKVTGKNYKVYIFDSYIPEAYCFGGFDKKVYVTKGLLKLLNDREVVALMLHEVGHITNLDSVKSVLVQTAIGVGVGTTFFKILQKSKIVNTSFFVFMIVFFALSLTSFSLQLFHGKLQEYRADKYTIQFGYGKDMITALRKMRDWADKEWRKENRGVASSKWAKTMRKIEDFLDVHPSFKNRIQRLLQDEKFYRAMEQKNPVLLKRTIENNLKEDA